MDFYEVPELEQVLHRSAQLLGVGLPDEGAHEIARRSRGTPRIANRLLRRVRDFADVRAGGVIDRDVASAALNLYEVDGEGLDRLDRAVLGVLLRKFGGGPVGLSTLAVAVGGGARDGRGGGRAVPRTPRTAGQDPARPGGDRGGVDPSRDDATAGCVRSVAFRLITDRLQPFQYGNFPARRNAASLPRFATSAYTPWLGWLCRLTG
ncbi:hypothetical protein GCM10020001_010080 [Nonomuraea salmonea]